MPFVALFVQIARVGLFIERLWASFVLPFLVLAAFVVTAALGLWDLLPFALHLTLLGFFALAVAATLWLAWDGIPRFPDAQDGRDLLERRQGLRHRPLTQLADRPATPLTPETRPLWLRSQEWARSNAARASIYKPYTAKLAYDTWGLRYLALLLLVLSLWPSSAFSNLQHTLWPAEKRPLFQMVQGVEVWVKPPAYTQQPGMRLQTGKANVIPYGSEVTARVHVKQTLRSALMLEASDQIEFQKPMTLTGRTYSASLVLAAENDARTYFTQNLRVDYRGTPLLAETLYILPDLPPEVAFDKPLSRTPEGQLQISYKARDDYGVTEVAVLADGHGQTLREALPVPARAAKELTETAYIDLTAHPLAGEEVRLRLEVKDAAGQTVESRPQRVLLPERPFEHRVAVQLVMLRKILFKNHPEGPATVEAGLGRILADPGAFGHNLLAYMALSMAQQSLAAPKLDIERTAQLLWQAAIGIDKGPLALQVERLLDAQRQLQEALARGESPEMIRALFEQLTMAMMDLLRQSSFGSDSMESLTGIPNLQDSDFAELMSQLKSLLDAGAHDEARKLLQNLETMLSHIQYGSNGQMKALQEAFGELNDIGSQQQQLLEDTFENGRPMAMDEGQIGQQGDLAARTENLIGICDGLGLPTEKFDQAKQMMQRAEQLARDNAHPTQVRDAQEQALQALSEGRREMVQQMIEQMGYSGMSGMRRDPTGRLHSGENEKVNVPEMAPETLSRKIRDELFNRADDFSRPSGEKDYLQRLLAPF